MLLWVLLTVVLCGCSVSEHSAFAISVWRSFIFWIISRISYRKIPRKDSFRKAMTQYPRTNRMSALLFSQLASRSTHPTWCAVGHNGTLFRTISGFVPVIPKMWFSPSCEDSPSGMETPPLLLLELASTNSVTELLMNVVRTTTGEANGFLATTASRTSGPQHDSG